MSQSLQLQQVQDSEQLELVLEQVLLLDDLCLEQLDTESQSIRVSEM